jgi:hypothetical protein
LLAGVSGRERIIMAQMGPDSHNISQANLIT